MRPRFLGVHGRRGWVDLVIVLCFTTLILGSVFYVALSLYFKSAGVPLGVYFLNYDLGGMTAAELPRHIAKIAETVFSRPIYLRFDQEMWLLRYDRHFKIQINEVEIARRAIKIAREDRSALDHMKNYLTLSFPRVDLPFKVSLDRAFTQANLGALLAAVVDHKVYARKLPGEKVELKFLSGEMTLTDVLDQMEEALKAAPTANRREIVIKKKGAKGNVNRQVDVKDERYGFNVVLAQKDATIDQLDPLTYDLLGLVVGRLNEVIINPGESLSLGDIVRRARAEQPATGSAELGLGILASAMYEPILKVGGQVLKRTAHRLMLPELSFVEPGYDAAMAPGDDLTFVNTQNVPLMSMAQLTSGAIHFEIRSIQQLSVRVVLTKGKALAIPFKTQWIRDATLAKGEQRVRQPGIEGVKVKVYRTYVNLADNRPLSVELISDNTYEKRDAIVLVPPGFVEPAPPKAVKPAEETPADAASTEPGAEASAEPSTDTDETPSDDDQTSTDAPAMDREEPRRGKPEESGSGPDEEESEETGPEEPSGPDEG